MSPEPVTAERIYRILRDHIVGGMHLPGTALNLQRLAEEFGSSVSPLRDAVHRLVGENLLQLQPGGGFQLPLLTGDDIRRLYQWHEWLVRLALRKGRGAASLSGIQRVYVAESGAAAITFATERLFEALGSSSRNPDHVRALANAAARLHAVRLIEPRIISRTREEVETLQSLAASGAVVAIRAAVAEYHRRRIRRSTRLAAALAHREI